MPNCRGPRNAKPRVQLRRQKKTLNLHIRKLNQTGQDRTRTRRRRQRKRPETSGLEIAWHERYARCS